jgi:hypothetical protein
MGEAELYLTTLEAFRLYLQNLPPGVDPAKVRAIVEGYAGSLPAAQPVATDAPACQPAATPAAQALTSAPEKKAAPVAAAASVSTQAGAPTQSAAAARAQAPAETAPAAGRTPVAAPQPAPAPYVVARNGVWYYDEPGPAGRKMKFENGAWVTVTHVPPPPPPPQTGPGLPAAGLSPELLDATQVVADLATGGLFSLGRKIVAAADSLDRRKAR